VQISDHAISGEREGQRRYQFKDTSCSIATPNTINVENAYASTTELNARDLNSNNSMLQCRLFMKIVLYYDLGGKSRKALKSHDISEPQLHSILWYCTKTWNLKKNSITNITVLILFAVLLDTN